MKSNSQRASREGKPPPKSRAKKRLTRFVYNQGPMYYLGQQIIKSTQDAGWDTRIVACYRDPDMQDDIHFCDRSRPLQWSSPHQYYEAVDLAHAHYLYPPDEYWVHLKAAVRVVEKRFQVPLNIVRHRDALHVEIDGWMDAYSWVRDAVETQDGYLHARAPTTQELFDRFKVVLPYVWKQFLKSRGAHSILSKGREAPAAT